MKTKVQAQHLQIGDIVGSKTCVKHNWSAWKEIGRTGDWFHPLIVERTCSVCKAIETDEY